MSTVISNLRKTLITYHTHICYRKAYLVKRVWTRNPTCEATLCRHASQLYQPQPYPDVIMYGVPDQADADGDLTLCGHALSLCTVALASPEAAQHKPLRKRFLERLLAGGTARACNIIFIVFGMSHRKYSLWWFVLLFLRCSVALTRPKAAQHTATVQSLS